MDAKHEVQDMKTSPTSQEGELAAQTNGFIGEGAHIDRFIGEKECHQITNLSRITRWRLIKQGLFPPKVRISPNRTAWRLSAILEWMNAREAA